MWAGAESEQDVLRDSSFASSLSPLRVLTVFAAVPIVLAHPIAAAVLPGSWDATQGPDGWFQYGYTLVFVGGAFASNIMSSYTGEAAQRASQLLLMQLSAEAARAQGFLETAMPSYIAQALLSRVPDAELTVSSENATVAFIALTRFDELTAQQPPAQLMEVCAAALLLALTLFDHVLSFAVAACSLRGARSPRRRVWGSRSQGGNGGFRGNAMLPPLSLIVPPYITVLPGLQRLPGHKRPPVAGRGGAGTRPHPRALRSRRAADD